MSSRPKYSFCPFDTVDFNPLVFNIFYPPPKIINHVLPSTKMVQYLLYYNKAKAEQSLYRPGQALRAPEDLGSQISRQSVHESGTVVSGMDWSP